ncbi:MAG: histidinol-phosphate aminotransferase family protein [Candidatus Cloacimonetes bacterium]|nr:histidinol-phosphate aminotransferase family protein [Candidatus Cloacimonadota bacterium]
MVNHLFRTDLSGLKTSVVNVPVKERMMCLNESCLDPYQAIREDFHKLMSEVRLNRYFSQVSADLDTALADYAGFGLKQDNIIRANGADDILYHIFLAVREGEQSFALSLAPSYFDYKTFCLAVGLKIKFQDLLPDFSFDAEAYIQKASDPNCRLAILCNPNNPTGNLFPKDQLRRVIEALPDKLVLIDETYYEYSNHTFADELTRYPNLILVRSFSKAFSGAGLRFGYAISAKQNIHELRKVFTTFHQSILVQAFTLSILRHHELFQNQVRDTVELRDSLFLKMKALPSVTVYPSATNFLTFSLGLRTADFFEYLQDHEIALRDVSAHPLLKDHLRITASCAEDVAVFEMMLSAFIG